ncbi:MAG TPA: AI-2E family transporter [Eoetvoesiella sp.]
MNTIKPEGVEASPSTAQCNDPLPGILGLSPSAGNPDMPLPRIHVNAHGMALLILSTVAFVFALQWAQEFFVPLIFGVLIAYTLNPLIVWMERFKIPRAIGTTLVMAALLGSAFGVVNSLSSQFQSIVDELPWATYRLSGELKKLHGGPISNLKKIQDAAKEIQKAANPVAETATPALAAPAPPDGNAAAQPALNVGDWLWEGSMGAAAFLAQLIMVLFLVFFLLLSGNTFKRKLVKLTGPSLSKKKITVQILDDINISIQRYMFMLLFTNILLALLVWGILSWMGLENAAAWGVASGLLHVIPYFGSLLSAVAVGLAAFLQFGSFSMMLLAAASSLAAATFIGFIVTTWMTGRIAKMNAAAVFIVLLFGGWLWGVWGMLLVVPLIVVVKVISTHVEGMQAIAELLGD